MKLLALALAAGTMFTGTHGAHGTLSFELSDDGKRVVAYKIDQARGNTCSFVAAGAKGEWEGATLSGGAFSYRLADVIEIDGRFDGDTATGTLRLRRHAGGKHAACDSGKVCWSVAAPGAKAPPLCPAASPTPDPPIPPPDPTPSGPSNPNPSNPRPGSGNKTAPKLHRSTVSVRRAARTLTGKVASPASACRGARTVVLRRGKSILARTTTKADGRFSFRRTNRTRGKALVLQVTQRQPNATTVCGADISKSFRG